MDTLDLCASETDLRPSRDVVIVQSKLLAPSFAGPGRWMVVDMVRRRNFLATGRDVVPEVIRLLGTPHGPGRVRDEDSVAISRLAELGLFQTAATQSDKSFAQLYHAFTHNYPFQDYSAPDWRDRDVALMEQYAEISPPPLPQTEVSGVRHAFRDIDLAESLAGGALLDAPFVDQLAFLLRFVFGKIADVPSRFLTCIRRTSPSGGARHPTDAEVEIRGLGDTWPNGFYLYDSVNHALIASDRPRRPRLDGVGAVVSLVSTVERAMWRYRDVRSYRPILIDLGHIAEMIQLVGSYLELDIEVRHPLPHDPSEIGWIDRPDYLDVIIRPSAGKAVGSPNLSMIPTTLEAPSDAESYVVNPFLYFTPGKDGLNATVAWPHRASIIAETAEFALFNHCVPSERGDRNTTRSGLLDRFPQFADRIDPLVSAGVLVSEAEARPAYRRARLWSRYGWYLSLLSSLDARESHDGAREPLWQLPRLAKADKATLTRLLDRRTCRSFSDQGIALDILNRILSAIGDDPSITISVAAFAVDGLEPGVYHWKDSKLVPAGLHPDRADIAAATIGQQPASGGAVTVWLLADLPDGYDSGDYETRIIALGQAGHRACVEANDANLGVFVTPALSEVDTLKLLGSASEPQNVIPYLLSIGVRR